MSYLTVTTNVALCHVNRRKRASMHKLCIAVDILTQNSYCFLTITEI